MEPTMTDFPKLHCPFVRQLHAVSKNSWHKHGKRLLRKPEVYLATPEVNPGYEWVFDDPETIAVEKLDGTNVKIKTENGRLVAVQNRLNVIDPLQVSKGKVFLIEGVFMALSKGYVRPDGEQAGEIIGPKLQANPYRLEIHIWYPFEKAVSDLRYKSFHDHDRTYENWSAWFKDHLVSRFYTKRTKKGVDPCDRVMAEGVIFYNLKRKAEGKSWRAKLRRDMFPWFYPHLEIGEPIEMIEEPAD